MSGAFWKWMLSVYPRPGVSPALIALQDEAGLNVNVLLFCCWLACRSQRLTAEGAHEIERLNAEWANAIVAPLRAVRRLLKTSPLIAENARADVRKRLQAIELELEERHGALLEERAAPDRAVREDEPEERAELANDNVRQYFAARRLGARDVDRIIHGAHWQSVVTAICAN